MFKTLLFTCLALTLTGCYVAPVPPYYDYYYGGYVAPAPLVVSPFGGYRFGHRGRVSAFRRGFHSGHVSVHHK